MTDFQCLSSTPVPLDWRYDSSLRFDTASEQIYGNNHSFVLLNGGSGEDNGLIFARDHSFEDNYQDNGRLLVETSGLRVIGEHAFCYASPHNRDTSRLKLRLNALQVDSTDSAYLTRETLLGMSLSKWPLHIRTSAVWAKSAPVEPAV